MQKILCLVFALLLITACDTTQPPKATVTRIEITPGTVLLTASGQNKILSAQAFDQNNKPMEASFTWASSKPEQVSIDVTGKVQANVAVGSSSITASSGGVKSDAVTAAVVELADGAVLVADAQVVTDFVLLDPALPDIVGAKLKVTLTGVANLVPGNLLVPSENKAFSGRVISSSDLGGGKTEVTLERVSIPTLFKNYSINDTYDFDTPSTIQFSGAPQPINATSRNLDENSFKLGPFKCKATVVASLLNADFTVKIEPSLKITNIFEKDVKQFSVTGTVNSKVTGRLVLGANVTGTVTCRYEEARIKIPIGGALAYFAGLQIPVGHKIQLKLSLQSPQLEVAIECKNTIKVTLGYAWSRANGWTDLRDFSSDTKLKPRFNYPTSVKNFRAEVSIGMFGYVGLDAGSPVLDFVGLTSPFSILELNLGIRAELKLASVQTQVDDSGYNSKYELKAVLEAGLGSNAKKLAEDIVAWTSDPDANGSSGVLQLKTTFSLEKVLTRSPFGAGTVDKTEVTPNEKVKFNIKMDPAAADLIIPPERFYNIKSIDFYRVLNGKDAELIKSLPASGGNSFDWEWTPTKADVGENKFYVFVISKEIMDTTPLEIKEDSKLTVNVSGDSFVTVKFNGNKTEDYTAPAVGSETSSVNVAWRFEQGDKAPNIQAPGIIFGQPTPGSGYYFLKPSLSGFVTHKGTYSLKEDCVCEEGTTESRSNIDSTSSTANVLESLLEFSVYVLMQPDGSYTGGVYFPNFNISGNYTGSVFANAGCPSEPQTPIDKPNLSGTLEQRPMVEAKFSGKIDLNKDTYLQGSVTLSDQSVNVLKRKSDGWQVPVTITIAWKLGFSVAATKSSSLAALPFVPSVLPVLSNPAQNLTAPFPWNQISPAERAARKPRC
jgi:hypothetical protein